MGRVPVNRVAIGIHDEAYAEIDYLCSEANAVQQVISFEHIELEGEEKKLFSGKAIRAEQAIKHAFSLRPRRGLRANDVLVVTVDGDIYDHEDNQYFSVSDLDYRPLRKLYPHTSIVSLYYLKPRSIFAKEGGKEWKTMKDSVKRRIISDSILLILLSAVAEQLTRVRTHRVTRGCVMDYCQNPFDILEALRLGFRFCSRVCLPALRKDAAGQAIEKIADWLTEHPFRPVKERTVFLSYAWSDRESVDAVDQWLRNKELLTRLDQRDFIAGNRIEEEIIRVMGQCSVIVIFYSRHSKNRPYPRLERELARSLGIKGKAKVIYFCLEDTPLPSLIEEAHLAIKAKEKSFDAACGELLRGIIEVSEPPRIIDLSRYRTKAPWD